MKYPFTQYFWIVRDEITGKKRQTRYRLTEEEARKRYGSDAERVEAGSMEITGPAAMYGDKPR